MRFPVNETMNERIKVCTGRSVREKKKKNRNGYQSYYFSRRYISRKKLLIGNVIAILREFSCKKKFFFSLLFLFSFSFFFRRFIELETTTNTITTITTTTITTILFSPCHPRHRLLAWMGSVRWEIQTTLVSEIEQSVEQNRLEIQLAGRRGSSPRLGGAFSFHTHTRNREIHTPPDSIGEIASKRFWVKKKKREKRKKKKKQFVSRKYRLYTRRSFLSQS